MKASLLQKSMQTWLIMIGEHFKDDIVRETLSAQAAHV